MSKPARSKLFQPLLPLSDHPEPLSIPGYVEKWEDYFLNIAKAVSIKSKDPKCPVGAVVTKFPCLACCNAIIQAGIKQVYTHDDCFWKDDPFDADGSRKKRVLHEARIKINAPYHPYFTPGEQITVPKRPPGRETSIPPARRTGSTG